METTIAAISTAMSASGIGIVRISGEEAIEIGNRVYRSKNGCHSLKDYGSHTIHYGFVMDGEEILRLIRPYLGEEARIKVEIVDEIPVLASGKRKYIENRCEKYQQHKGFCG